MVDKIEKKLSGFGINKNVDKADYLKDQMARPGQYASGWESQMNDLMDQIQNRPGFQYDVNADALWNQYKDQYVNQGRQAMMDTMGQAQAMTGGYGNSYAQTVGQQTYQGHLQGLNDKIPDLYGMAFDRYQAEGDQLLQQYGLMADRDNTDYARYMDAWNRYQDDRAFDYQRERDAVADEQWQTEWDEAMRRWQLQWDAEHPAGGSGGGGSSGGGGGGKPPKKDPDPEEEDDTSFTQKLANLETTGATSAEREQLIDAMVADGTITPSQAVGLKHIWAKD